jgi:exopolyphosphatase/guanosine-5'-triphosphate,3'-diphosphate pyrophosphatase
MEVVGARRMLVSGQGLREGLALSSLGDGLHPATEVRTGAIAELAARFTSWRPEPAARRRALALALLEGVDPKAPSDMRELLGHAATILDIGRSVDFYNRHEHTAAMLIATDLEGFTHPAAALLAAIIERSGGKKAVKAYRPLVTEEQEGTVVRYGAILRVADELERRHPPGPVVDFSWKHNGSRLEIRAPWLSHTTLAAILAPHGGVFHDAILPAGQSC